MSVGLLSLPFKCASRLRQLPLPASITFGHQGLGRYEGKVRGIVKVNNMILFDDSPVAIAVAVDNDIIWLDI